MTAATVVRQPPGHAACRAALATAIANGWANGSPEHRPDRRSDTFVTLADQAAAIADADPDKAALAAALEGRGSQRALGFAVPLEGAGP